MIASVQFLLELGLFASLNAVAAQQWAVRDCNEQWDLMVREAGTDAMLIARAAKDVLDNHRNDAGVSDVLKIITGDGPDHEQRLAVAKGHIDGVAGYDLAPSAPFAPARHNTDVILHCGSHYRMENGNMFNNDNDLPVDDQIQQDIINCHQGISGSQAETITSDSLDREALEAAYLKYFENEDLGISTPEVDPKEFLAEHPDKPNTIDLCHWFLDTVQQGSFNNLDVDFMKRLTDQNFYLGDKSRMAIVMDMLPSVILHEMTHTVQGGRSVDGPKDRCYGWDCATGGRSVASNGDTLTALMLSLWMWKEGFFVQANGDITT